MTISKYDNDWKKLFEVERKNLLVVLNDVVAIEHVGSTAITNQKAKPIIDIFIACTNLRTQESYESQLSRDYVFVETGMKGRYLFNKKERIIEYNVHIMAYDDDFYERNEILFRDYLNSHVELVEEYGELKEKLMEKYGLTFEYTFGKTQFIQKVVDKARIEKGLELRKVWE